MQHTFSSQIKANPNLIMVPLIPINYTSTQLHETMVGEPIYGWGTHIQDINSMGINVPEKNVVPICNVIPVLDV